MESSLEYRRQLRLTYCAVIALLALIAAGCGGGGGDGRSPGDPPGTPGEFHFPTDSAWTGNGDTQQQPGRSGVFGWLITDQDRPPYPVHNSHLGIDIAAPSGAPVYAITNGTVEDNNTAVQDVVNKSLWIRHDRPAGGSFYAVYGHVNSTLRRGASVSAGQQIATIAPQGISHLHLGIRPSGVTFPWGRGMIPVGWRLSEDPGKSQLPTNGFVAPRSYLSAQFGGI